MTPRTALETASDRPQRAHRIRPPVLGVPGAPRGSRAGVLTAVRLLSAEVADRVRRSCQLFKGQRSVQPSPGLSNPTSASKISAHFATQTWQMMSPTLLLTTRTSRLWRPQNVQATSLYWEGLSAKTRVLPSHMQVSDEGIAQEGGALAQTERHGLLCWHGAETLDADGVEGDVPRRKATSLASVSSPALRPRPSLGYLRIAGELKAGGLN